ncbi:MAG: HAD hydrolase-like protein [Bacteriovorax sp.]|jgi:histidinol phosphatase-like enzyme|nr:HAD hydrolase-like protein [Bacteriovorax sp.]
MKKLSGLLFLVSLFSFNVKAQDKAPWIYFDLGDTVINTSDMKHLKYMHGAREYMDELKREGFRIGIITNIPEAWGMDYDEKLLTLKKAIQEGWDESEPFDWGIYDEIILPLKNSEMKPAPTLFLKAINRAGACPSAYIGESPKEIAAASQLGMAAKLYNEKDSDVYIPVSRLRSFIAQNYHRDYDLDCLSE